MRQKAGRIKKRDDARMFDILGVALYEEAVCHLPDGKVRVKQHCAFLPASR
ncbi:uncharacterized protein PHALS_00515 [Plasmopara halstedii]|uniref:Uncharacterized protein n=1 Tax=Plasmopara halstedii TaxID=4781 RepID=A0A0P1A7M3_PLAHL|nr:uncharacterized protein PHALS_00515 [Plasmopara halstedii]CEG36193.1 hypothetical protein PHALS_00515 [Plasmopara halstedii]|eukprot:XP_024572562.1 hypothetical protein PHALS_00515 [Plasmopara halstedii]